MFSFLTTAMAIDAYPVLMRLSLIPCKATKYFTYLTYASYQALPIG
jgi:hypothetical protein